MTIVTFKRAGQVETPTPPVEIADEVELYAREHGRHGKLEFVPTMLRGRVVIQGTWRVCLTLKADDKRLLPYRRGEIADEPTEDVWLHERDEDGTYQPLNIVEMGASGVRQFLERGNLWSGRGEFDSLEDQRRKARAHNEAFRQKTYQDQEDAVRQMARDTRRKRLKIPFLPVGIRLTGKTDEPGA